MFIQPGVSRRIHSPFARPIETGREVTQYPPAVHDTPPDIHHRLLPGLFAGVMFGASMLAGAPMVSAAPPEPQTASQPTVQTRQTSHTYDLVGTVTDTWQVYGYPAPGSLPRGESETAGPNQTLLQRDLAFNTGYRLTYDAPHQTVTLTHGKDRPIVLHDTTLEPDTVHYFNADNPSYMLRNGSQTEQIDMTGGGLVVTSNGEQYDVMGPHSVVTYGPEHEEGNSVTNIYRSPDVQMQADGTIRDSRSGQTRFISPMLHYQEAFSW
ncbi:MAG: hypothetical protein ACYCW6_24845 [Candidatus Xenobia bacterium]